MVGPYTIDASVFLNAFNPQEAGHGESLGLLTRLQDEAVPIVVPTLLLSEVAGAIGQGHRDTRLAHRFAATLSRLSHLLLIPLDIRLAQRAAEVAAEYRLRGSDAVYAAVALQFGATLITLDQEQRRRIAAMLPTRRPREVGK